jgi:hypothetical protein
MKFLFVVFLIFGWLRLLLVLVTICAGVDNTHLFVCILLGLE